MGSASWSSTRAQPVRPWHDPAPAEWDYSQFASPAKAPEPDETFTLTFRDIGPMNGSQFDTWTINNQSWPKIDPLHVRQGRRYRMIFRNGSGDQHPMHLHRHTFEVTRVGHKGVQRTAQGCCQRDAARLGRRRFCSGQSRRYTAALPSGTAYGFRIHAAHEICGLT